MKSTFNTKNRWRRSGRYTDDNNAYMTDNSDNNNEMTLETYKTNWKTIIFMNCNS